MTDKPYVDNLNDDIFTRSMTPACNLSQQRTKALSTDVTSDIRNMMFDRPGELVHDSFGSSVPVNTVADLFKSVHEPDEVAIVEACLVHDMKPDAFATSNKTTQRPVVRRNYKKKDQKAMRRLLGRRRR
jgi:hypothetical protein